MAGPATQEAAQETSNAAASQTKSAVKSAAKPAAKSTVKPEGEDLRRSPQELGLELAQVDLDRFGDIPYRIDILIGKAVKKVKEILEMEVGDTVVLDRPAHETVLLTIEGVTIAQAEVVSSDSGASIQISDVGWEA
ncbi:MAG TPA: FliM/FliN family flagellar motor switch protein [Acidobacteriota bacterium]|nr:FliM/FliN family flagellar motor switch protein [Acidobacteriota bacterium]